MRYLIVFLLAGCASTTEVVPYGSGMYLITANSSGSASRGELQTMAAKEANAYCTKQGKTMQAKEHSTTADGSFGTTATLVFSCK